MLGTLVAVLAVIAVVIATIIRRDVVLYGLIAIFILTAELGDGFTSFQGSIFFNQDFLKLANFKLVEVILFTYLGVLIMSDIYNGRKLAKSPLSRLFWLWIAWLVVLIFAQFETRGSIDLVVFRDVYFGFGLLYVFRSVLDSRRAMGRLMTFTLILVCVKVAWLMAMYALGHGDRSPRGSSPIFWDDKLIEAFVWAFLVLLIALVQPRAGSGRWPTVWVASSLALVALVIVLSLRRNYLGQVGVGMLFVLFNRGSQVRFQRFVTLSVITAVLLGVAITAGQVVGDRVPLVQQWTEYAQLLNFSSPDAFTSVEDNQVHLFNVQTYTELLSSYPSIRYFGVSAAPTEDFRNFNRDYLSSLGLAHNGPLRSIFDFGLGGLAVWLGFFYLSFRAMRRFRLERFEPWERAVIVGSAAAVFAHFVITLTLVPPFFTTLKGFFLFVMLVYIVEFYAHMSQVPETELAAEAVLLQPAENYATA